MKKSMTDFALLVLLLGAAACFCRSTSIGPANHLETYSSRYTLPTNDPLPYSFGYRFRDESGTLQEREEQTDASGAKTGSYGFVDADGTFRRVEYVADRHGFRATVRSNEPGVVAASPAHVSVNDHFNGHHKFNTTGPSQFQSSTPYKGTPFPIRAAVVLVPASPPAADPFEADYFDQASVAFGNKLPDYDLGPPQQYHHPRPRAPRRFRDNKRGRRGRRKGTAQYRVHTPRGYENHHNLPLYRDK